MHKKWNREQIAFLQILRHDLFNLPPRFPENVDWYKVFCELRSQKLLGLSEKTLDLALAQKAFVPVDKSLTLPDTWHKRIRQSKERFFAMMDVQQEVVDLLTENGIHFVILKGACSASFYPLPEGRFMNDIDFLVEPKQADKADGLLRAHGFDPIMNDDRHIKYQFHDVAIEMHRKFSSDRISSGSDYIDELFISDLHHPDNITISGYSFPSLSRRSIGLCLLAHMKHHLRKGMGFRHFLDWVIYASKCANDAFWNSELKNDAERLGLASLATVMTRAGQLYLGLPANNLTWCLRVDKKICHDFLQYLFDSGDFGQKDFQTSLITNVLVDANTYGFFHFASLEGLRRWPLLKKYPILRPFAGIFKLFRYTYKFLTMKHPFRRLRASLRTVSSRKRLFRKLGV